MGVFSGSSDRLIGQNSSFLDIPSPIQEGNDAATKTASAEIQYIASLDAGSIRLSSKISM